MAGHSKFKNIMHRKGKADAMRSKLFGKLSKEITIAAKLGGTSPDMNPRLRAAITSARHENMPKDRIIKAIEKSTILSGTTYEEILYEAYGPYGSALLIQAQTDNRNRVGPELRSVLTKAGGNLAEPGAVTYLFQRLGHLEFPKNGFSYDKIIELALSHGADDALELEETYLVLCSQENFNQVTTSFGAIIQNFTFLGLQWIPNCPITLSKEQEESVNKLVDQLDQIDDVQFVNTNLGTTDSGPE